MADTVDADSFDAEAERRLADAAVRRGWLAASLVRDVLDECERTRKPASELLRSRGHLTDAQLRELLSGPAPAAPKAPPEVEEAIAAGAQVVSRYVLVRHLKTGGMGLVFKGWDRPLGRWVAIKLMKSIGGAESREQFLREARLAANLEHPNIADVYEIGEHDGAPFIAMQFIDGSNLWEARRTLTRDLIVRLMRDVCDAVQYAHDKGIVHRDLKPMNLMIDRNQRVFVLDFGIAKQIEVDGVVAASGTNVLMGTPEYMPPEQARGSLKEVDRASDVYSLGASLYELLTGRPPFQSENRGEVIAQVIHDEPVPVRRLVRDVPADLETITMKCLEKDKSRRYASARDVGEDLARFAAGDAIAAHPPSAWYRFTKRVRKRPVVYVLGLALVLAVTAGGTFGAFTLVQRNVALSAQVEAEADARRKEEQRARAEEARRKTEEEARLRVEEEQGRTKAALVSESQARKDAELAQKKEETARRTAEEAQKKEEEARKAAEDSQKKEEAARKEAETQKAAALRQLAYGYHLRARALGETGEHGRAAALYAEANRQHGTRFYAAKAAHHLDRAGRLVAAFPLDGTEFARVTDDGSAVRVVQDRRRIRFLNLDDGTLSAPIDLDDSVRRVVLSPDASRRALLSDKALRVVPDQGTEVVLILRSKPADIDFDASGQHLHVLYDDGDLETLNAADLAVVRRSSVRDVKSSAQYWDFASNGRLLYGRTDAGQVHVLDMSVPDARLTTVALGAPVTAIAFNGNGHLMAAALSTGRLLVRRVADAGPPVCDIACTMKQYGSLAFAGDDTLCADTADGVLRIDAGTGAPKGDPIANADVYADGSLIVERLEDGTRAYRDPATGARLLDPVAADGEEFVHRGRSVLLRVPHRGTVGRIHKIGTRDPPRDVDVHGAPASVHITRDGRVAIFWQQVHSVDTVETWSGLTARGGPELALHGYGYTSALSADGTLIADRTSSETRLRIVSERGTTVLDASAKIVHQEFDPRSQHLVAWDGKRLLHWSRATGRVTTLPQIDEKTGPESIYRDRKFAFTRDGKLFALGGRDGSIRIWDLDSDQLVTTVALLSRKEPGGLAFHPGGQVIAAIEHNTVNLYDRVRGTLKTSCPAQSQINDLAFRSDGTLLATADDSGRAILWDASSGQRTGNPMEHFGEVSRLSFDASGRYLLAGTPANKTVYLWDAATQSRVNSYVLDEFRSGHVVENRRRLVLIGKQLQIWDLTAQHQEFAPVGIPGASGECWLVAVAPDGSWLATTHRGGAVHLLNLGDPRARARLLHRAGRNDARLAFSPDGARLAVAADFTMVFDVATGEPVGRALSHAKPAEAVEFSADGRSLIVLEDETPTVWDVEKSRRLRSIDHAVRHLSPHGRCGIRGFSDATVVELETGKAMGVISDLRPLLFCDGAWTRDGTLFAGASEKWTEVGVWSVPVTGDAGPLLRHRSRVSAMAFHADGRALAVGTADGLIYIWDVELRELIALHEWRGKEVMTAAFGPGTALFLGAGDGSVCRLSLPYLATGRTADELARAVRRDIALTVGATGDVGAVDFKEWRELRR